MIESIVGDGHIVVTGNYGSAHYINSSTPSAGILRYYNSKIEVYNGISWESLASVVPTVGLSGPASEAITWAINKMQEERQLDELCDKYPSLGKARGNYETIKRLVESGIEV
jgi:hypothetical protein